MTHSTRRPAKTKCPPRDLFVDLYCYQQLSAVNIACKYGVSDRTVMLWANKFGICVVRRHRPKKLYIGERQTYMRKTWSKAY